MTLSSRHNQILNFVRRFIDDNGYSPSFREIAEGIGIGLSATAYNLERLKRDGLIDYREDQARTIRITGTVMKAPEETM